MSDYPAVRRFTIRICEGCLESRGEMCNTPACVFCWHSTAEINEALNILLIRPVIDGERLIGDEGEPDDEAEQPATGRDSIPANTKDGAEVNG